jgi:hypothetical protein
MPEDIRYTQPVFKPATQHVDQPKRSRSAGEQPASFTEGQQKVLIHVIADLQTDLIETSEKKLATAVTALREEFAIEAAVARDEIMGRIDAKLYGRGLVDDFDPRAIEKTVHELRSDLDRRADVVLSKFWRPGNQSGDLTDPHSIAVNSKGDIIVGEVPYGESSRCGGQLGSKTDRWAVASVRDRGGAVPAAACLRGGNGSRLRPVLLEHLGVIAATQLKAFCRSAFDAGRGKADDLVRDVHDHRQRRERPCCRVPRRIRAI